MSIIHSFRVFLDGCLSSTALEIFDAVEKIVMNHQEDNDRLRKRLGISPEIKLPRMESLQVGWNPSLEQDPEPIEMKEKQEELMTHQEEEQFQGVVDTKDSIFTPPTVKSECGQTDTRHDAILGDYPTLSQPDMFKLQSFSVFLNDLLAVSTAVDILRAVKKTVLEYQEENDHLLRMLRFTPEINLYPIDSLHFSLAVSEEDVPPEQQHLEQEASGSLGQNDPEPIQIKEEKEELRTSQDDEPFQGLLDTKDSIITPSCVKSEYDQEHTLWSSTLPPTVKKRESYSEPMDFKPFDLVTHLKSFDMPCDPPDNQHYPSSHSSVKSSDQFRPDSRQPSYHIPPLDPSPPLEKNCSNPSTTASTIHRCHDCGETFALKRDVKMHVIFAMKKPSTCRFCKKRYSSTCKLKAHVQLCHSGNPCVGTISGEVFKQKKHQPMHMSHTGEKPFICGTCGKSFCFKGILNKHLLTHTREKLFSCEDCGKSFSFKWILNKHMLTHTGEKPFSCEDCGKCFNRKDNLATHLMTHTGEKPFSCGDCGKSFRQKETLKKHKIIHSGDRLFSCGDCGKSFTFKGRLNKHMLTHTGEKSFSCRDCGKHFSRKGNLATHMMTHTGQKPFSCGDCEKSFSHKSNLATHMLTHTGEKPFSCDECEKSFRQREALTKHKRVHTGEKPFSCGVCGKSFSQRDTLTKHKRVHTEEKPFSCGDCGKSFRQRETLTKHKRVHTEEKPFSCDGCGKSFRRRDTLTKHKHIHTGEKPLLGVGIMGKASVNTHRRESI